MATENKNMDSVLHALNHVQQLVVYSHTPNAPHEQRTPLYCLFSEDWDWLVVMQTLVELGIIHAPQQRPPFAAFLSFLKENHVRTYLTHIPSKDTLSRTNLHIEGATYPWNDVQWQDIQNTLPRWRKLHDTLIRLLQSSHDE